MYSETAVCGVTLVKVQIPILLHGRQRLQFSGTLQFQVIFLSSNTYLMPRAPLRKNLSHIAIVKVAPECPCVSVYQSSCLRNTVLCSHSVLSAHTARLQSSVIPIDLYESELGNITSPGPHNSKYWGQESSPCSLAPTALHGSDLPSLPFSV